MGNRWLRLIAIGLVAVLVFLGSVELARDVDLGRQLPSVGIFTPTGGTPPGPVDCRRDPANLPPPPVGPDGRPANYFHTCGGQIFDSQGHEVKITGLNWSGMETSDDAPGGLGNRNWEDILDQIAALGYNTIRVPYSDETLSPTEHIGNVNFSLNPDLQGASGLQMLDKVVAGARARGLKVILDRHQPTASGPTELWYNDQVSQQQWIAEWQMLAARYAGDDTVIGVDLANEPHGPATWGSGDPATDWHLAAEKAGNAVLSENPYLLIFVEGVASDHGDEFWWGGNLDGVRWAPVNLRIGNRVVYSPHDYGPAISDQTWFHAPNYPENLPEEWDRHWGYIQQQGIAPVVVGEFGGWSLGYDADGKWQRTLLAYLKAQNIGFFVWDLNPTWDTGGILEGNWQTVNAVRQAAYHPLLAPPLATGPTGVFGQAPTQPTALFHQDGSDPQSGDIAFTLRIYNDGPTPLDLSRVQARYWFTGGPSLGSTQSASIDTGDLNGATVQSAVVPTTKGGQSYYLQISFAPGSGSIPRYLASGEIRVHLQRPGVGQFPASQDYSFVANPASGGQFQEWNRVTLYLDHKLAWGHEP